MIGKWGEVGSDKRLSGRSTEERLFSIVLQECRQLGIQQIGIPRAKLFERFFGIGAPHPAIDQNQERSRNRLVVRVSLEIGPVVTLNPLLDLRQDVAEWCMAQVEPCHADVARCVHSFSGSTQFSKALRNSASSLKPSPLGKHAIDSSILS